MIVDRPPDAIQWHEGMLLAPQHLQQLVLRQEALLHYHLRLTVPYCWGVRRLRVDGALLAAGVVRLLELEAVLPDGALVAFGDGEDGLQLDLEAHHDALRAAPLRVHLALPARRAAGPLSGELARFASIDGPPVCDESTGEGELRIPRLRPRARLLAGATPPAKFVSLPVLEVAYQGDALALTDFLAPQLAIAPGSALGAACGVVAARLREKAALLGERARSPGLSAGEPTTLETRRLVAGLVAGLPAFEALLASGVAHPFSLHLELARLAGQLAALGDGLVPPAFPAYDHDDLRRCLQPLLDYVLARVDGVATSYRAVPFRRQDGAFVVDLAELPAGGRLVVGARRRAGMSEEEVAEWLDQCRIGSADAIAELAERRILGARRERIERDDELGVVPTGAVALFVVRSEGGFVRPHAALAIANPFDPGLRTGPQELLLYQRAPAAEEGKGR